ncbi:MAG: hypothetical protein HY912_05115 [Desulfomonile tiedjei]|uniref:Uncharacterized protein n=1 Tax=Desulfomonile tiedjei TaxID=2358 RepID=A0A9D6UYQ4_9BACT|nr:hypothetical protein [Desulfomonile tiedjei]
MSGRATFGRRGIRSAAVLAVLAAMMLGPDVSMSIGTPVPGYSGWTYSVSGGYNWYFYNDLGRFAYQNSTGVWYNFDRYGGNNWRTLSAAGTSSSYLFDGAKHDLLNGWRYAYDSNGQTGIWLRSTGGRFAYNYSTGRWSEYDPLGVGGVWWQTLSAQCRSVIFVGRGALTDLGNGFGFVYDYTNDTGLWAFSGAGRYGYNYTKRQWYDYTVNGWAPLSRTGQRSSAFIGNGTSYQFGAEDWFIGHDNWYGWSSGGHEACTYDFTVGQWMFWLTDHWSETPNTLPFQNQDCRYLYDSTFVVSGLRLDTGGYAPVARHELASFAIDYSTGTPVFVGSWRIHNTGADNRWSGGDLNVAWGNTWCDSGGVFPEYDVSASYGEFTKEDVIFFAADFGDMFIGFTAMVDWMTLVRDYYGKQIRTVQVAARSDPDYWFMGEPIIPELYSDLQADWQRWGGLMTSDGQIVSLQGFAGNHTTMLNDIARWSGCDIYANTNDSWTSWSWLVLGSVQGNELVWNYNYNNVTWYDNSQTSIQRFFEYTTTGLQDYRWLFSL